MDAASSGLKMRGIIRLVISAQYKSLHHWWYGGALVPMEWAAWKGIWKGTINAERYIEVLEQHMLPSRQCLFQGRPCIFQQDNAKPHTASITTAWLRRRRVRVLNWPACSPDLSPIENIWHIMKQKIRQRRPRTVEQLESYIRQEWDNIPLPKLQQLVSSVPRCLRTVVKRRGDATQW